MCVKARVRLDSIISQRDESLSDALNHKRNLESIKITRCLCVCVCVCNYRGKKKYRSSRGSIDIKDSFKSFFSGRRNRLFKSFEIFFFFTLQPISDFSVFYFFISYLLVKLRITSIVAHLRERKKKTFHHDA